MKPIRFAFRETLPLAPEEIAEQILDVAQWPSFRGYGPIPGIKSAEFETRTPNVVGSRIRVWLISFFLKRAIARQLNDWR